MGHPTMQENDTAKLTPTVLYAFSSSCLMIYVLVRVSRLG